LVVFEERRSRFGRYAPLVLNVIGWVAFLLLFARLSARDDEARAFLMEAEIAKLASAMQTVADRLGTLETDVRNQLDQARTQPATQQQGRSQTDDLNRRLSEAQMKKLESATARLEDEIGNMRQRTQVTVDLNALVQGLRPNISFDVVRVDIKQPGIIDLTFQARNLGPYAAVVEFPELILATKPIPQTGTIEGQLTQAQDYSFKAVRMGTLLPSQPSNHAYTLALTDPRRIEQPLYYRITFRAATDPTVVATATRLLRGRLLEKEVQELSVLSFNRLGELTVGQQRP
jgi:hypothetical protein